MSYYFNKTITGITISEVIDKVTEELKKEGFGIISEINIGETLKKKIDVNFKNYYILGACNPHYAHRALLEEDKIGLFLPCNIVVSEENNRSVEVSIVDPIASMSSVDNKNLGSIAQEIRDKLKSVIESL